MTILIATGAVALVFGFLFLFSPATITLMTASSKSNWAEDVIRERQERE